MLRGAQAYACPDNTCGRNFAHDDGFGHKTHTGEHAPTALGDRACGKMPRGVADNVGSTAACRPARPRSGGAAATRASPHLPCLARLPAVGGDAHRRDNRQDRRGNPDSARTRRPSRCATPSWRGRSPSPPARTAAANTGHVPAHNSSQRNALQDTGVARVGRPSRVGLPVL